EAVPLQDGIEDDLSINGPYDHLPYGETVRRTVPALRTEEYEAVHAGRVLYKKAESRASSHASSGILSLLRPLEARVHATDDGLSDDAIDLEVSFYLREDATAYQEDETISCVTLPSILLRLLDVGCVLPVGSSAVRCDR